MIFSYFFKTTNFSEAFPLQSAEVLNLGVVVTLGNRLSLGLSLLLVLNLLQLEVRNKVLIVLIRHHLIPGIVGVLCSSYFKGYW